MKLSESEVATLVSICDALIPHVDDSSPFYMRKASDLSVDKMLAESVEEAMQPSNARDFGRVLRVFDSRLYNLLLTARPVRFTSLNAAEKERYLASWRDSSIGLKRTAFQALKRLTCFLAYAATDASGRNPNWPDIGYPGASGDKPAVLADELRITPLKIDRDTKLECDVCIIGSGAGGGVTAEFLASAGLSVLIIEQGAYDTSETFKQSESYMMQKLFQQSGTASTKDLSFVLLAGRGAGGGTTVNWNACLKPQARILKEWETEFGLDGVAGPRFASYLDDAWKTLQVNDKESQRNPNNQVLWDGCSALGYQEGVDYEVIQRNTVDCHERCDFCEYGCIYGCKKSTAVTYLPEAQKKGARFLFKTRAERVIIEGGEARGVTGIHHSDGRDYAVEVKSRAVVVACGGIETPALLLRSGIKDKNLGNFLRLDPTVPVGGVFEKPIRPWAGPPLTVAIWKFIDLDGTYHGFWIEAAPAHPGLFALSIPWLNGKTHKDFMRQHYARSSASIVLLRERSWGKVGIDSEGNPAASYDLGRKDRDTLVRGVEETARILAAAGAVMVWTTHNTSLVAGDGKRSLSSSDLDRFSAELRRQGISYNRTMLFSAHLMGSVRMSADPGQGPTAPSGELHVVRNLYIGDSCVFPTTPAVNPMIAIMAFARQTAESIANNLKDRR
jgi:choline dehydrogenase-like flavoprotein